MTVYLILFSFNVIFVILSPDKRIISILFIDILHEYKMVAFICDQTIAIIPNTPALSQVFELILIMVLYSSCFSYSLDFLFAQILWMAFGTVLISSKLPSLFSCFHCCKLNRDVLTNFQNSPHWFVLYHLFSWTYFKPFLLIKCYVPYPISKCNSVY